MAVCYTNDMDDLVLLYERVDSGSLHTYLYQKVVLTTTNSLFTYLLTYLHDYLTEHSTIINIGW